MPGYADVKSKRYSSRGLDSTAPGSFTREVAWENRLNRYIGVGNFQKSSATAQIVVPRQYQLCVISVLMVNIAVLLGGVVMGAHFWYETSIMGFHYEIMNQGGTLEYPSELKLFKKPEPVQW